MPPPFATLSAGLRLRKAANRKFGAAAVAPSGQGSGRRKLAGRKFEDHPQTGVIVGECDINVMERADSRNERKAKPAAWS